MKDLFDRTRRFQYVHGPELGFEDAHILVLTDIDYWIEHYHELEEWCSTRSAECKGMTVSIYDDTTLTEYLLRWS